MFNRLIIMGIFAASTLIFSVQTVRTWTQPPATQVVPEYEVQRPMPPASPNAPHRKLNKGSYDLIVQGNLFSQSRTDASGDTPIEDLKPAEASRYAKRITLYGVIIKDGEEMALVNSDSIVRDGQKYMWVRVGDAIGRLQVAAIKRDRILVSENGSHFEIRMSDRRYPHKQVGAVDQSGPTVIVTDSSG